MATSDNLSSETSCPHPQDSNTDSFHLFVIAGVAAVAIAVYVSRRFAKSHNAQQSQSDMKASSAACALARAWLSIDPDPDTRTEVSTWLTSYLNQQGDSSTHDGSFSCRPSGSSIRPLLDALDPSSVSSRLRFGTAGVRSVVGAGYDRINAVTVINVAQAVASSKQTRNRIVVVAHDARPSSRKFAVLIARVFLHANANVRLFSQAVPTPLAAFDALTSKANVALVVTASHNPRPDNGVKVYDTDGIQLRPSAASRVEANMQNTIKPWCAYEIDEADLLPLVTDPLAEARSAYVRAIVDGVRMRGEEENARAPPAVYTACHGVGYAFIKELFHAFGLPSVIPCEEQCEPNGNFPTLPFPNPEEKGALDIAIATARRHNARLILANDPDADRFAAAELGSGDWDGDGNTRIFTGDEIAALLADYITTQLQKDGSTKDLTQYAVVASTVSSKFLASMARKRGFSFHESQTGFKWLNKTAVDLENDEKIVILTYEEAIGYNITRNIVRDKDGVSAAALFYEMTGYLYESGNTLTNRVQELFDECGVHLTNNGSLRLSAVSPSTKTIFDTARSVGFPKSLGGVSVQSYRDLTNGVDTAGQEGKSEFPADPTSQFLTFRCSRNKQDNDCPLNIHLRGSGTGTFECAEAYQVWYRQHNTCNYIVLTFLKNDCIFPYADTEPKIKFYSELRCSTEEANNGSGRKLLEGAMKDAIETILKPDKNALQR